MTIANNIVAKLTVAFVAVAMTAALVAPVAQAATDEEMQAQIADLMATIAALQAQIGQGGGSTPASSCASIPAPLTMGAQNAHVTALQNFLIGAGQSIPAGATGYFGGQTQAALAGWQAANGVAPAVGYYGPITQAAMDAQCVPADDDMGDDMDDSDSDSDDSDSSDDGELEGGEADVNSYEGSAEEDEAEEGEEDVAVYNMEFDVEDGDVRLERMDVRFDATAIGTDGEDEPWDAFDEISLWIDGDKVASEDATDEDDWDETTSGSELWEFRFTNVDSVFREDDTGEVIVAVSVAGSVDVDGDATEDDWTVRVPEDGMRFVDSEGIDITGPAADADAETFEIVEAGDNDDLDLESSSDDPEAATLEIDEDSKVEHLIFAFDLSAEDSEDDVVLDNLISVAVTVGGTDGTSLDNFIDDFRLEVGGESFDAESYTGSGTNATVNFDIDGDVTVPEDEEVTALLYAIFDDAGNSFSDATIFASTTSDDIDAEGDSSGETIDVDGASNITKTGETHTVRTAGISLSAEPTDGTDDGDSDEVTSGVATDDNYGTMFLEFEISVFGEDAWIPTNDAVRGNSSTTAGVSYRIETSAGAAVTTGTTSVSYDIDGADEDNGFFELEEGETYTMTVSVDSYNPTASGSYQLQVNSVSYSNTEDTIDTDNETPANASDYESDAVQINS